MANIGTPRRIRHVIKPAEPSQPSVQPSQVPQEQPSTAPEPSVPAQEPAPA